MKTKPQKSRTKTEQVALTITLGFLSIAACGYVVISYYGSVKTHIERIAESAFMGTTSEVSNWIEDKKTTIDLLGKGLGAFGGQPETIQPLLKQTRVVDLDFIDIFYGTSTTPAGGGYAVYASDWKIPAGYDWTTRP
jgi:hypothetical protein